MAIDRTSHNNGRFNRGRTYGNNRNQQPTEILPEQVPEDYVDQAERVMKSNVRNITTSKIRNIYSLATDIYNKERLQTGKTLKKENVSQLQMMRVRVLYEGGRDRKTKQFIEASHILEYIKGIGTDRELFLRFAHYLEALVAYHRYFGGKEG